MAKLRCSSSTPSCSRTWPSERPEALDALADRADVRQAYLDVYGEGLNDEMDAAKWNSRRFGGAEDDQGAADWVADQAQAIAAAAAMTDPFEAETARTPRSTSGPSRSCSPTW